MQKYRSNLSKSNNWTLSTNATLNRVADRLVNIRTFQFKNDFITEELLTKIKAIQNKEELIALLQEITLPKAQWLYEKDKNKTNDLRFALILADIEMVPNPNAKSISMSLFVHRNKSIIDLVKHGEYIDDANGFEDIQNNALKTEDFVNLYNYQEGLFDSFYDVFYEYQKMIAFLIDKEKDYREIEDFKKASYYACSLPKEESHWLTSGACQLDLKHHFDEVKEFIKSDQETSINIEELLVKYTVTANDNANKELKEIFANIQNAIRNEFKFDNYIEMIKYLKPSILDIYQYINEHQEFIKTYSEAELCDILCWGTNSRPYRIAIYIGGLQALELKGNVAQLTELNTNLEPNFAISMIL